MIDNAAKLRRYVEFEASKCIYCGFCEPVCPTLPEGPHRGYGPRGRVYLSLILAKTGSASREALDSLYSCLLCYACHEACPAEVDIVGIVRTARRLVAAPTR